ncbi:transmembrane 220 family protein [Autumnicola patrickiae]
MILFSANLQLNDPDPLLWFSIYLSGAILCDLPFLKRVFLPFIRWP